MFLVPKKSYIKSTHMCIYIHICIFICSFLFKKRNITCNGKSNPFVSTGDFANFWESPTTGKKGEHAPAKATKKWRPDNFLWSFWVGYLRPFEWLSDLQRLGMRRSFSITWYSILGREGSLEKKIFKWKSAKSQTVEGGCESQRVSWNTSFEKMMGFISLWKGIRFHIPLEAFPSLPLSTLKSHENSECLQQENLGISEQTSIWAT